MLDLSPPTAAIHDLHGDRVLDLPAINRAVHARATRLAAAGAGRGAFLAISRADGTEALLDCFAAWQIGAVAVLLSPTLVAEERVRVAAVVRPALWLGAAPPPDVAALADAPVEEGSAPPTAGSAAVDLDAQALVLMTSGTTARPKGVVHTHRSLRARLALNVAHIGAGDLARSLAVLPMHFGHGLIGNALTCLAAGGTLLVWSSPGVAGLGSLGKVLDQQAVTFMSSVPSMWRIVLRTAEPPRSGSLRRVHIGSEPLSAALWEEAARWCGIRRVLNMYGLSEAANWIAGQSLEDGPAEDGLVGRAWGGAIRVAAEDGTLLPEGRGEVVVSTPALMSGYLDQPELSAAVLERGWLRTGDTGTLDAAGRLRLHGRRAGEINRAGVKVSGEEVDLLLERHPDIAEACTFAVPDSVSGEIPCAAVVLARPLGPGAAQQLLRWCASQIRAEAVPAQIYVVDELPRSERGKLDRTKARELALGARTAAQ